MVETNKLNRILLDSLPHWAMLIDVKTRTILAANKMALDGGAGIDCQCWDDFGHRQFISEEHKKIIEKDPDRKRDKTIMCDFCLADDAMESGQPTRKEVEIEGTIWDTWWVPVEKDTYLHYAMDITSIRKTQAALQESEERYLQAVNTMRDGLAIASGDGLLQFVNSALCDIYQYSRDELIGTHASRLIHPDYHHVFQQFMRDLDRTGHFSGETVNVRKNGTTFNTDIKGAKIQFNEQECFLAVIRDISERKNAERLLKRQEMFYRSIFEKNQSVMLLINPDSGAIIDANPSACAYYGYSREEFKSMAITDINTLSRNEVFAEMEKARNEDRNYFNFPHRLSDETIRQVEVFSGPVIVNDKTLLCSIIHDISERKLAERERERLIGELKAALLKVKTLSGLLPICAACKKIRDDKGYWNQIETYIRDHSDAKFSHGICPECAQKLYPDLKFHKDYD